MFEPGSTVATLSTNDQHEGEGGSLFGHVVVRVVLTVCRSWALFAFFMASNITGVACGPAAIWERLGSSWKSSCLWGRSFCFAQLDLRYRLIFFPLSPPASSRGNSTYPLVS